MLHILLETSDLLAVDKPEGLASIHERGKDCLLSLLSAQFPEKLYIVHRLDKEISGVILFARNAAAHKFITVTTQPRRRWSSSCEVMQRIETSRPGGLVSIRRFAPTRPTRAE